MPYLKSGLKIVVLTAVAWILFYAFRLEHQPVVLWLIVSVLIGVWVAWALDDFD